jgi:thiol:disulfide interchange protein/DsbC/DsbD-like thiol-disulfide interchange protein
MKHILSALLALFLVHTVHAQEVHSKASLVTDYPSFVSGMKIGIQLDLEPGWHAYWENPGDVGAEPKIVIESLVPIEESSIVYPIPARIVSDPYDSYGFENETLFYKTIRFENKPTDDSVNLKVTAEWLVCQSICVPCSKSFSLNLPVKDSKIDNSHFEFFSYPQNTGEIQGSIAYESDATILTITSPLLGGSTGVDFFPTKSMKEIFNKPSSSSISGNIATFRYAPTSSKDSAVVGLVKLDSKKAYWIGRTISEAPPISEKDPSPKLALWYVLLLSFIGGMLLNLMPCVLPVVSLKVLSLLKTNQNQASTIRKSNLWFSAGICVSLILFSLIFISVRQAGQQLGWGFQLQSPSFVSFLTILFFLIGLNLIDFFEVQSIPLPGLGRVFQKQSASSDFISGFFTTLIATPCTAPFMAVAVGFALSQNNFTIISTFLALGVGLSFPYLVLAGWPQLGKLFPKPGAWMVTLKEFLAFPMFLTVAWLVWLLAQLTNSQSAFFMLTILILVVFFFWVRTNLFNKNPMAKKILMLLVAGGIFVMLLTMKNPKMSDTIDWQAFNLERIEATSKDAIVFVDFTADWCITCKANERITFSNAEVIKSIQDNNVVMFKADWTRQNPEITSILRKYDRAGVPFYLLYKPGLTTPMVLPTLLTPSIFMDAITQGETK